MFFLGDIFTNSFFYIASAIPTVFDIFQPANYICNLCIMVHIKFYRVYINSTIKWFKITGRYLSVGPVRRSPNKRITRVSFPARKFYRRVTRLFGNKLILLFDGTSNKFYERRLLKTSITYSLKQTWYLETSVYITVSTFLNI